MNTLESAYAAGFFDADGCVAVAWVERAPWYRISIEFANTNEESLKRIQRELGGKLYHNGRRTKTQHARHWTLHLHGREAVVALDRMMPFLDTKRERAAIALMSLRCSSRKGEKLSEDARGMRLMAGALIQSMNSPLLKLPEVA